MVAIKEENIVDVKEDVVQGVWVFLENNPRMYFRKIILYQDPVGEMSAAAHFS